MKYEHVFSVTDSKATPLQPTEMAASGFWERQHLQEWVIERPEMLGEDVLIVTSEFDRWVTSAGDPKKDRLDVLGIDSGGQLVVVELKRDTASNDVDLQAIKYAALVSRFTDETLVDAHRRFLSSRRRESVGENEARENLESHVGGSLDPELWSQPSIVLLANSFPETVTNTVVWLSEAGLDLKLLRYQMYASSGDPLLVVSQIYPVPDTDDFLLEPRREEVKQARARTQARRRDDVVKVLVRNNVLPAGTPLTLQPTEVNEELRTQLSAWLDEDPSRAQGTWLNDVDEPIRWAYTDSTGKPTTIASHALREATGVVRQLHGPRWWRLDDGTSLAELAEQFHDIRAVKFDWSGLHRILSKLPKDRWTTYGDLSRVVGTAPQPLGSHLASCPHCVNAVHVLTSEGVPATNFSWLDRDETRSPIEVLRSRGIRFDADNRADQSQRLSLPELETLLEQDVQAQ